MPSFALLATTALALLWAQLGLSCPGVSHIVIRDAASPSSYTPPTYLAPRVKVAIKNVRVFDGFRLLPQGTVFLDGDRISHAELEPHLVTEVIDGQGGFLLPGLIDSHAHPQNVTHIEQLRSFGVTTVMSMACFAACDELNIGIGYPEVRLSWAAAAAPNSTHARLPGWPDSALVSSPEEAASFVAAQVEQHASYIKIIAEVPGIDQDTLDALVQDAHASDRKVMAHASQFEAVIQSLDAGVDFIHHVPLDKPLTSVEVGRYRAHRRVSVPTLFAMSQIAPVLPGGSFPAANTSATLLNEAHVPILAGTDASAAIIPGVMIPFGVSLHSELEKLVEAGVSPFHALRAAISLPAHHFGLHDRGAIHPGMLADLVLVRDNPFANISNTRSIERVWIGGIMFMGDGLAAQG